MLANVPRHCQRTFIAVCRPLLVKYMRASLDNDQNTMLNACVQFMSVPAVVLSTGPRADKEKISFNKRLREVAKKVLSGNHNIADPLINDDDDQCDQPAEGKQEQQPPNQQPDQPSPPQHPPTADQSLRNVKRAQGLLRSGHIGKAARALTQAPPLDVNDPAVLDQLKRLHPDCKDPIPALPAGAPLITIDATTSSGKRKLRQTIRRLNNGSAAGPSGMNGAHLQALAQDDDCLLGMARLMQDIANGAIGDQLREYITSSTLIPLPKANSGVRPIAIGEVIKRAADSWINEIVVPIARQLCEPHQFGLGTPGGCEKVLHGVNGMLNQPDHKNTAFLLDMVNAFNEQNRASIITTLLSHPQLAIMFRLAHWTYRSPTALRLNNGHVILSQNGVKQGETLGSLLFALSMRSDYAEAASLHADTVRLFAVMDDATFVGPAPDAHECSVHLCKLLNRKGLKINYPKSTVLSHSSNQLPEQVTRWIEQHSVTLEHNATPLLGAPIGWDDDKKRTLLQKTVADSQIMFDQLLNPALSAQDTMIILRVCTLPTFGYLMRVVSPSLLFKSAQAFDDIRSS
jgi:hypothetical protein